MSHQKNNQRMYTNAEIVRICTSEEGIVLGGNHSSVFKNNLGVNLALPKADPFLTSCS